MNRQILITLAIGLLIAGFGPRSTADDKDDAIKKDMKLLEGVWLMQSFESNGNMLPADQAKTIKLTIKGNRYTVDLGEQKLELTFTIDPTKKPKAIDVTITMDDKKAVTKGIYEVSKDSFRICRTQEAGKDRPSAFAAKEGSGLAMATYKRQTK